MGSHEKKRAKKRKLLRRQIIKEAEKPWVNEKQL